MLPKQGLLVLSLIGELRCHMLCSVAKIIYWKKKKKTVPFVALWHSSPSRPTQFMGSVCAISTWPAILPPASSFPVSGWLAWRWSSRGPVEAIYCEWQSFSQWSEGGHLAELSRAPASTVTWARNRVWMPACYSSWWGPDYTDDGDVG